MKNNKEKLKYIILPAVFACTFAASMQGSAFCQEVIKAQELPNLSLIKDKPSSDDDLFTSEGGYLGDGYYKININPDKEEFYIKSIGDFINARKKASETPLAEETKEKEDLKIFCDEMEYFEDRNELEARGNVEIITESGANVKCKRAIYNKETNIITLYNNIILTKGGSTVTGDYMVIDMNEENALMDEPVTRLGNIVINAKEGYAYSDKIENINGNIELNQNLEMELFSQGFARYGNAIEDTDLVEFEKKNRRSKPYRFTTKEIIVTPERDHDVVLFKDVKVYRNNRKIATVPSIEFFSNKEMTRSEANFPLEFGSLKGFGMYLGMGYTFKLPESYTFRLTPAISYGDDEIGLGAMAMLKSDRLRLEGGWASSTNNLIVDGQYKFNDRLKFDIGRHVYKGEWFNGGTRAGYIAELSYDDSYLVKDLGNTIFRHRIMAGYVADYRRHHQEDDMQDGMRYRYMAELSKRLKTFGSREQDMFLSINAVAQTMASVYSETGDTFGMVRVGPSIQSRLKRWNSTISYTLGGVHGKSPYYFDEYRYGKQTISFDESLILSKYLSLGYRGTLTPLKDNSQKDMITENRLYAVVGPEDFKMALSYDTIRQNMHFDFLFLLGSDNLDMKYDTLTVQNPDKLGKKQRRQSDKDLNKITIPENL